MTTRPRTSRKKATAAPVAPVTEAALPGEVPATKVTLQGELKPAQAEAAKVQVETASRESLIANAAYLRAAQRGFAPGHELTDWLQAEREIDALLAEGAART